VEIATPQDGQIVTPYGTLAESDGFSGRPPCLGRG
jgi:hypothetical protein